MIFGIEYKTLPSFLGFIRPRNIVGLSSFILILSCVIIGLLSIVSEREILILRSVFNIIFFTSVVTFSLSVYALGGFDNSEIVDLIQGEKKARYILTVLHVKIIFIAALFSIPYGEDQETYRFALYDLAIHTIAIGFIGITISLYLLMMLPPIIGKTVLFTSLNKIPLVLIVLSLGLRAFGDIILAQGSSVPNFIYLYSSFPILKILNLLLGLSGWLVLAAMVLFVITLHRSMK